MKKIAITSGDPAGIGPEITSKALRFFNFHKDVIYIVYGKLYPFKDGSCIQKIKKPEEAISSNIVYWIEIDSYEIKTGKPSILSGKVAIQILERCAEDLNNKKIDAVVTCPISKEAIQKSYPTFIGHTEFFAQKSNTEDVIMSFWGPYFNLALITTHLAVCDVSEKLTRDFLLSKLQLIYMETTKLLRKPKIAMLAVNPHAGEKGAFGQDDILIESVLEELSKQNIKIYGPFPADTFFATKATKYDLIISAYHDQGLIPFKMISSEEGVNVTLGLPFVRTSVDHGTAYDIAGKNIASEKSLLKAIHFAEKLLIPYVKSKEKNYTVFAKFYDKYMAHVNYDEWVKFILSQYNKKNKKKPAKILELACGTANIACRLVKKNLNVDAVDNAEEMLKIASKKPFCPNLFCRDMLDSFPSNQYDLIILLFDSFNYLLKDDQINKLFKEVHNALMDNGLFIFDITTLKNCEDNFDGFVNIEEYKNKDYFVHQSEFDYSNYIQTTKLTFFLKKGFNFIRKDEIHKQKIYKVREIVTLISKSDLTLSGIYSIDRKDNLLNQNIDLVDNKFARLFFVLEKNAVQE